MDDVAPPDSGTATRALELCALVSPPFLLNHSSRAFAWGCILARRHHISFDRELFYVGAMLHDLGLTTEFDGPRCFEHESAAAASRFAAQEGWGHDRRLVLAEAIRLHMQARVVIEDGPEAYLLSVATACDVRGRWLEDVDGSMRTEVLERFPRLDFKTGFVRLFEYEAQRKPGCMADIYLARGFAETVRDAPFDG